MHWFEYKAIERFSLTSQTGPPNLFIHLVFSTLFLDKKEN